MIARDQTFSDMRVVLDGMGVPSTTALSRHTRQTTEAYYAGDLSPAGAPSLRMPISAASTSSC
jgi:hypothetical protein